MKRRIRVLHSARFDLAESSFFYEMKSGEALAERFERAAEESFERIIENPNVGSPRRFRNPRLQGIRMWQVRGFEKHLIFYREAAEPC